MSWKRLSFMKGAGNVYLHGAKPSVHDRDALVNADFKPDIKLEEKADGWWLKMTVDPAWVSKQKRTIVTSEALGKAKIPDAPFENPDGSPFKIDADYFGKPRNPENPAPGPFSFSGDRDISVKVWPLVSPLSACAQEKKRPNVLMIAVDDLNDWIGCLGGHQQAKTPHIDHLASRGVVFSNAHCQSPVCNPSRVSMMTSLYPATTGIYFIAPGLESSEVALKITTMPQRFEKDGYYVTGAGKLFHGSQNGKYHPNYKGSFGSYGPSPKKKLNPNPSPSRLWDWGVYPESNNDEEMPDHKIAAWGVAQLEKSHDKPLYLGVGFYRPHVPMYVPQKWFDMYPLENIELPKVIADDLSDLSPYAIDLTRLKHISPTHEWVLENNQWKPMVQSYLACVSFVDHQVGKLLDALERTSGWDNTYVVLYSDHGWHLGEKERWAKRSLWDDATEVIRALKSGEHFVTSGEILIHSIKLEGAVLKVELDWTFPLDDVRVITFEERESRSGTHM